MLGETPSPAPDSLEALARQVEHHFVHVDTSTFHPTAQTPTPADVRSHLLPDPDRYGTQVGADRLLVEMNALDPRLSDILSVQPDATALLTGTAPTQEELQAARATLERFAPTPPGALTEEALTAAQDTLQRYAPPPTPSMCDLAADASSQAYRLGFRG